MAIEKPLYMVKIGGSVITDVTKQQVARREEIVRLLDEIYYAKLEHKFDVIVGHGSGSFGHTVAHQYKVNEGLVNDTSRRGAALTKIAAMDLNRIVVETGVELGMPVFPFSAGSFGLAKSRVLEDGFAEQIRSAIAKGFMPVVYGDVVMDTSLGASIASTEEVLRFISTKITPAKVILGTDVDGVFDKDPTKHHDARLISSVNYENYASVLSGAGSAKKVDVTGGMKLKVSVLYEMARATGAVGYILNASKPGVLRKVLEGDPTAVCTRVARA